MKIGTDSQASLVDLASPPTPTTVAQLTSLALPSPISHRVRPTELTVYTITATLTDVYTEHDMDRHMPVRDNSGHFMITELPDLACVPTSSAFYSGISRANAQLAAWSGSTPATVQITGVGFFDGPTGQSDQAPNQIELHPILNLNFNPGTSAGSITGTVTSSTGGTISGASVSDGVDPGVQTDSSGHYALPNVAAGTYTVTATASGFVSKSTPSVTVTSGNPSTANFVLTPAAATGTVTGTVTDTRSVGISGASVSVTGGPAATTTSGGTYTLAGVPAGAVTVVASAPGFNTSAPQNVSVTAGQTTPNVNFTLTPTGPPPTGGPKLVQSAGAAALTATFPAPTKAGDLLVLSAGLYTGVSRPITSVTDGRNTWTKIGAFAVAGKNSDGELWYAANGLPVTSVTVQTGAPSVSVEVLEFSGIATTSALDGSTGTSNAGTTAQSGPVTLSGTNDLVVGFVAGHGNAQAISVAPGYTAQAQQTASSGGIASVVTGYQVLAAPSASSFGGSFPTAMSWAAGVAAFKASGTAPPAQDAFSMGLNPSTVAVTAAQSATTTVTTTVTSGATQSVALSASGLPAGATATFNPTTISSGQNATLTIATSAATPPATSTVTVTGTGSSATHTTPLTLTVNTTGSSAPQLVQASGAAESGAATSLTDTLQAPSGAGHLLVLSASVYTGTTNPITSVTDSANNTWTRIGMFAVAGHYSDGEMWFAANANPATSVTVHTASAAIVALEVQEFSGIAATSPVDVSTGTSNTGNAPSSGTVTPLGTHDLVVAFIAGHSNVQPITITAPGYTAQVQQTSSPSATVVTGYQVLNSAGAQSFTGSFSSPMYWAAAITCFKAPS